MGRPAKGDVAERRRRIGELYLKGFSQTAIGRELAVDQSTVSREFDTIRQDWKVEPPVDCDAARRLELRKLDLIEREAWAAWQRSQAPLQQASLTDERGGQRKRTSLKHRYGDARFLDLIHKCIAQRSVLLGLQPPPAPPGANFDDSLPLAARIDRVFSLVGEFDQRRRIAAPGAGTDGAEPGLAGGFDQRGEVAPGAAPGLAGPPAPDGA